MRINRVVIDNFCSIHHAEISPSEFNVFVGQNNHGKTNLFEALNWFYTNQGDISALRFGRTGDAEVSVEIEFVGVQTALALMKNDKNRASIEKLIGTEDSIRAKRATPDNRTRKIFDPIAKVWLERNPTGFDSAFNDLLPLLEYVDSSTHLSDVTKYSKTSPIGTMLSGVLMALLEHSKPYKDFRQKFDELFTAPESDVRIELDKIGSQVTAYITKQFPDCTIVKFQITEPAFEDLLKGCTTEIDDGILTSAAEKGDGMQRALMLAILQTYADFRRKGEASGKRFLFLIDEAELHLHPTAQRHLKAALRDIASAGDQVFINTHSSVLVADESREQTVFSVEKWDRKSSINPVTETVKPAVIYDLLGGSPADLLLPRNFLIVEGKSDQIFVQSIIDRFYADKPPIQIIFSEGDFEKQRKSMDGINAVYAPLALNPIYKDRLVILCDHPHPGKMSDFDRFKNSYKTLVANGQLHVLPTQSLEEYYPSPYKKTPAEVEELGKKNGLKRHLAGHVGKNVSLRDIQSEMPALLDALKQCWENAHV
ncbi:MAG TPA: AAA family ATPase [Candidatus Aquilonibacter sp.]|nr:AAA family ATPase [Candidatus Aquilonibacter sp.]